MTNVGKWELDDLISVKKMREDKALKALHKAKEELESQIRIYKKHLRAIEVANKNVKDQAVLMHKEMKDGTTRNKVEQRGYYIEKLKEVVDRRKRDLKRQREKVKNAKEKVNESQKFYSDASKEVNKLKEFRKDWEKNKKLELLEKEESEMDEVGNIMFENRRMKEVLNE